MLTLSPYQGVSCDVKFRVSDNDDNAFHDCAVFFSFCDLLALHRPHKSLLSSLRVDKQIKKRVEATSFVSNMKYKSAILCHKIFSLFETM